MPEGLFIRIPASVQVKAIIMSRYPQHLRPACWNDRKAGVDVVETIDGREVKLVSEGGQSPPKPGWEIVLTSGDNAQGYHWTLYGLVSN